MITHIPPIRSGPFAYHSISGLEVDCIPRCSSDRLYNLLTYVDKGPVLTKKGVPRVHQPPRHKDETLQFYQAQCVHYGLEKRSSKAAVKKKLLDHADANGQKFKVPKKIIDLEKQLGDEFDVKNKQEGERREKERARKAQEEAVGRKKRKREDDALVQEIRGEGFGEASKKRSRKSNSSVRIKPHKLAALYRVVAPDLSEGWDCAGPLTMRLGVSSTCSHIWGDFKFGAIEGILRSTSSLTKEFVPDNTITFHWRGREEGEGETTFSERNIAKFEFVDETKFCGTMYWECAGTFDVVGRLDAAASKNKVFGAAVPKWKREYRSLNEDNYGREEVSRWGKWAGDARPDAPMSSDTSENESEDEKEDEEDDEFD
ncbi:MAG: hypothetical protein M1831_001375 [Alyxoria varia]|nr:MAG: hypothetical protein M1831_001375 [Alyxoria varia]